MIEYMVARGGSARHISPVELTPGFPPLAFASERKVVVFVQPAEALPNGEDIEGEILRNHGVHTQERGLAVVQFDMNNDPNAAAQCGEAADLWCEFARLLGWRIWGIRLGDGLPPFEIGPGVRVAAMFGHGNSPLLIPEPPQHKGLFGFSSSNPSNQDAA